MVYVHNGILFIHKKQWNNAICSNMDGLKDQTKWSKSDRETEMAHNITLDMWNLKKNDKNVVIYKTDSPIEKKNLWLWKGKEAGVIN